MKVGLIAMASNENLYIRDWVEYNKKLGFASIIFADNSPENGDYPLWVIGDYIADGYVIYENRRHSGPNENLFQEKVYTELYEKYYSEFDFIAVLDIDEFLTFSEESGFTNVNDYLSQEMFNDVDQIKINWKNYNDNGLCHYDSRPVYERFTSPTMPIDMLDYIGNFQTNSSSKVIINCHKTKHANFYIMQSPHVALTDNYNDPNFKCVNNAGKPTPFNSGCTPIDYTVAYLRHYRSLTIEEFLFRRCTRGDKDARGTCHGRSNLIKLFASENKITREKKEIIENFFRTSGKKYGKSND